MNATREFLDRQYGQTTGTAWIGVGTGRGHTETKFDWPAQADEMVRAIGMADFEDDVWFAAHLSSDTSSRSKGSSIERLRLHADIDRDLTTQDRQKIAQLGAWTVQSGSAGHAHVYVELDQSVSLEEYERLQGALAFFLDADKSKVRDNDLLRIPGTTNHKPAPKGGPVLMGLPYEKATVWSPALLATILPVAQIIQQKVELITSGSITPEPIPALLSAGVQYSINSQTGDRSQDAYALICEAAKANLTIGQTLSLVLSVPALAERYQEKGIQFRDSELHRIWAKASQKANAMRDDNDFSGLIEGWTPEALTNPNINSAEKPPAATRFKMFKGSETAPARKMQWLAKGRIPQAATTILVGNESIGKSLFWAHLAAIVTNGWSAPYLGIEAGPKRYVMLVLNEDDWTTQAKPRLQAAGVDLDYVLLVAEDAEGIGSPTFPDAATMDMMRDGMREMDVALVVVDTWMNTLRGVDIKDPVKARNALQPWTELAQEFKTSVLLVTHTNRLNSKNTRDVMGGTSELRKAARSTLFAQLDDQKRLTVGVDKSNVAAATHAAIYDKVVVTVQLGDDSDEFPILKYVGDCDQTAQEILEDSVESQDDKCEGKVTATEWVEDILRNNGGSMISNDLMYLGKAAGYSENQIQRAKLKLGVKGVRQEIKPGKMGVLSVL